MGYTNHYLRISALEYQVIYETTVIIPMRLALTDRTLNGTRILFTLQACGIFRPCCVRENVTFA